MVADTAHSPATKAQAVTALRPFLTWARTMGAHSLSGDVLTAALRVPRATVLRPYTVLTEAEIAALIGAASTPRDTALLAVLLGGGLRVAEVVGLDCSDVIDVEGGAALHVRQGKGRKDRVVPILPSTAAAIRRSLAATGRALGDPGPLFLAHDRAAGARGDQATRLSARSVGRLVTTLTARAGIDARRVSPHSLRHSYAVRALRAGANVAAVSKLLGHANVATTSRYLDHLAIAELRAAVPELPGLSAA